VLADDESTLPTPHPKLRIAKARPVDAAELTALQDWVAQEVTVPDAEVRNAMLRWVPEYTPDTRQS